MLPMAVFKDCFNACMVTWLLFWEDSSLHHIKLFKKNQKSVEWRTKSFVATNENLNLRHFHAPSLSSSAQIHLNSNTSNIPLFSIPPLPTQREALTVANSSLCMSLSFSSSLQLISFLLFAHVETCYPAATFGRHHLLSFQYLMEKRAFVWWHDNLFFQHFSFYSGLYKQEESLYNVVFYVAACDKLNWLLYLDY